MHRILFELPGMNLYSWGVAAAAGFGLASLYFLRAARAAGVNDEVAFNLLLGIILFALVGARALYIVLHLPMFFRHPVQVFQVWKGGMVLYGGLGAAFLFALYYIRGHDIPFVLAADAAAPAIALGLGIGRIGCFLNGCCYGCPVSWGLVFPPGSPAAAEFPATPVFPTQPISAIILFCIATTLHILRRRAKLQGMLFPLLLILYGIHRFTIEYMRADTVPLLADFTVFQFMSAVLIAAGIGWVLWQRHLSLA